MKETGGVLTVRTGRGEGVQVLISVCDTGVGLPTGMADEIFNAFFTTKPQGSGMGLAISRSIVESHGGRLWATSNDGRGATFYFALPTEVTKGAQHPDVFPGSMPSVWLDVVWKKRSAVSVKAFTRSQERLKVSHQERALTFSSSIKRWSEGRGFRTGCPRRSSP
jgi:hypothetical protein